MSFSRSLSRPHEQWAEHAGKARAGDASAHRMDHQAADWFSQGPCPVGFPDFAFAFHVGTEGHLDPPDQLRDFFELDQVQVVHGGRIRLPARVVKRTGCRAATRSARGNNLWTSTGQR